MTGRIALTLTAIGFCVFIPLSSSAVGIAPQQSNSPALEGTERVLAEPFTKLSVFIDGYAANRFIRANSAQSFTSDDIFAAPYKLLVSEPDNKAPLLEAYGMMLASLALMGIIAYRRLTSDIS